MTGKPTVSEKQLPRVPNKYYVLSYHYTWNKTVVAMCVYMEGWVKYIVKYCNTESEDRLSRSGAAFIISGTEIIKAV